MSSLKIAVIGGGSSYTPELIEGFIKRYEELPLTELWLVDIPNGQEKLTIVSELAKRMVKKANLPITIVSTLDRIEALKQADFVLTQLRVGGLEARQKDEAIPLKQHTIGQETTGPGGFAKALRTIPVVLDICRDMAEHCPEAWLINFTNPAGMVTEAILTHTKIKAIGLCNVPIHMTNNIAEMMDLPAKEVSVDFTGLNHLVWGQRVRHKDTDITAAVLDKLCNGESLTMKNIPNLVWDADLLRTLQMVPCPYLRYFYMKEHSLEEELTAFDSTGTRAVQVMAIEKELFEIYKNPDLNEKPKALENRGGAYYSDAACSLISSIYNDKNDVHTVDILNQGAVPNMPYDCVVELNAVVGKNGAKALNQAPAPNSMIGLMQQIKAYERLTIEAVTEDDVNKGVLALINHPLVADAEKAKSLAKAIYFENFGRSI